jgi:hypothetical protein
MSKDLNNQLKASKLAMVKMRARCGVRSTERAIDAAASDRKFHREMMAQTLHSYADMTEAVERIGDLMKRHIDQAKKDTQ